MPWKKDRLACWRRPPLEDRRTKKPAPTALFTGGAARGGRRAGGGLCDGRHRLHRSLLRGPYGVVYLATDTTNAHRCILQKLHPHFRSDQVLASVQRDAVAAAGLGHPAILAPFATGFDEDGSYYLASEILACESLRALLASGPLPPDETLHVLEAVCAALTAASRAGLHHGRLSPACILRTPEGKVLLTDFGVHHLGLSPSVESSAYLPPEIYQGDATLASGQGDVFALGALVYECLSGGAPLCRGQRGRGDVPRVRGAHSGAAG